MLPNELTISDAHAGLAAKKFSCRELVTACLDKIHAMDDKIHAFLEVLGDEALARADEVDKKIGRNDSIGLLEGIPIAIKDNILIRGHIASAGSKILENHSAAYDATVISKLRSAGAIFIGRTNMDEFAMGGSTETSAYGVTRNPHDTERIPGGSSGGSAAAVAGNMCIAALGSDTGGSIRQPAALCGVVGMKPTYGRVSRYGLIAMASSLDQIGPITKSIEDARTMFHAIACRDAHDATTVDKPLDESFGHPTELKGLRIGIPKEYFIPGMDPEIEKAVRVTAAQLQKLGCLVKEVSLPHASYALAVYYVVMPAEVSANMARYDGIRYGVRHEAQDLMGTYQNSRSLGFGDEVRRRIMLGTYALSSGYYDAYYKRAMQVRTLVKKDFDDVFRSVDVLLTPTTPNVAWKLGEKFDDPVTMYLEDIFTVSANVAGVPAISVPCGSKNGLPIGAQFIAPQLGEETLFAVASALPKPSV